MRTPFVVWLAASFILLTFSRLSEFVSVLAALRLTLLIGVVGIVAAVLTGGLLRAFRSSAGIWLSCLTVWMFLSIPFSLWMGGSVSHLIDWLKSFAMFFIVAGLLTSVSHLRKGFFALASSAFIVVCMVLTHSAVMQGRMEADAGSLGNANDLADQLLICLPFCVYIATDRQRNKMVRGFFVLLPVLLLGTVVKTGSREALLGILVLGIVLFFKTSGAGKMKLLAAALAGLMLLPFFITQDLKYRYLTVFMGEQFARSIPDPVQRAAVESALESSQARRELLAHAGEFALEHPLFGVGMGQFAVADAARAHREGESAYWHTVHNMFAIVLAELGFPAFICFCAVFFCCFRIALRTYNRFRGDPRGSELARLALTELAALVIFFVCGNFATAAYTFQLPILAGLAAALDVVARRQEPGAPRTPLPVSVPVAVAVPLRRDGAQLSEPTGRRRF